MSQPAGATPKLEGDKKVRKKVKNQRRAKSGVKVRVRLPPIESYEKDVDFRAEGPGRVIVRLERLMGSDRVRLTDPKYMAQLLEKLEEEETKAWVKRTKNRKKTEMNRVRQLCIDGLTEPTDDMQDLYKHPVFRVNRVLKKLAVYDQNMSIGQHINLPPIITIEPFENDESGSVFKSYPRHEMKSGGYDESSTEIGNMQLASTSTLPPLIVEPEPILPALIIGSDDEEEEDEMITIVSTDVMGEEAETETGDLKTLASNKSLARPQPLVKDISLTSMQKNYGISPKEDLSRWEGFRSDLVDMIYVDAESGTLPLYQAGEEILGVYERESATVDDFVLKLNRMMGASGGT